MVQNLQFQHMSFSKVASEQKKTLTYQNIQNPIYSFTIKRGKSSSILKKKDKHDMKKQFR